MRVRLVLSSLLVAGAAVAAVAKLDEIRGAPPRERAHA